MQFLVVLLLCGQVAEADTARESVGGQQLDEVVHRHREFAVSRLKADDPFVASAALDALATLDFDSYGHLLREELRLPLTDASLVALTHLIKRATPNDLKRVRDIVEEAAKQGQEQRKTDPYLVNAAAIEFLALEVLLASENAQMVQFATTYLEETIKRNPGPGPGRMEFALDLIGRYSVKSAIPKIGADVSKELRDAVLIALAKNGNQSALSTVKRRFETARGVAPYMMADSQLVSKLSLTADQLRVVYRTGDRLVRTMTAGQLARMGHMEELRAMTKDVLAKPKVEDTTVVSIVSMVGLYGDGSFVPDLDAIASSDSELGRLWAARSIFQVMRRTKSAAAREKQ